MPIDNSGLLKCEGLGSGSTTSQKRNSKMPWEFSPRNLPLKTAFQTGGRDLANIDEKQIHNRNAMVGFVPLF